MNAYDIIAHNNSVAALAEKYWDALTPRLNALITEFDKVQQGNRFGGDPLVGEVSFSDPETATDDAGCACWKYCSSLGALTLYKNIPPGSIYGEIEMLIPPGTGRKTFAVQCTFDNFETPNYRIIGNYAGLTAHHGSALASAIFDDLSHQSISESQLLERSQITR